MHCTNALSFNQKQLILWDLWTAVISKNISRRAVIPKHCPQLYRLFQHARNLVRRAFEAITPESRLEPEAHKETATAGSNSNIRTGRL